MSKSTHCSIPFLFQRTSHPFYGLASVTDIGCKPFVNLLRLIDLYHTYFTVGSYHRIEPLSILPQYADSISILSVNLTVEDLGLLDTLFELHMT